MTAAVTPAGSSCSFTTRLSLRWVPEIPEETTDTVVLSVGEWFVDLRMDKKSGEIDWAMAGTRIEENPGQTPLKVLFTRELDSLNEIGIVDVGNFSVLPNGDELEQGEMPRADLPGAPMTTFEEVWRVLPFMDGPDGAGKGRSWILESDHSDVAVGQQEGEVTITKVFMGRIWGCYLAFKQTQTHTTEKDEAGKLSVKRTGGDVSARREEWNGSEWTDKYVIGPETNDVLSMRDGFEGKASWSAAGDKVVIDGVPFIVRAFEELQ